MALATLSIDLVAKVASFEKDLKRVVHSTEQQANAMSKAFGVAKAGLAGLAGAFSAGVIVNFVRQTINGIDALNDLKDATGASIENLSALEDAAIRSGNSFHAVADSLVKFNKVLIEAKPDSDMARVLSAIGLSADELRKLDPADALRQTAVALSRYADDGNKARLIQELFGKSIREAAPWLKDLVEAGKLNTTVTTQQAEAAERFNKALAGMQKDAADASRVLVTSMIPAISSLSDEFVAGMKHADGFWDAITTFGAGINPFRTQAGNMQALREELDRLTADRDSFLRARPDIDDAIRQAQRKLAFLGELQARQALRASASLDVSDALSRRLGGVRPSAPAIPDILKPAAARAPRVTRDIDPTRTDEFRNAVRLAEERQRLRINEFEDIIEFQRRVVDAEAEFWQDLIAATPTAELEAQRELMQRIATGFMEGRFGNPESVEAAERYGEVVNRVLGNSTAKAEDTKNAFKDLGLTFSSALEDALVNGKKFSDVLRGLADDITRIITRKLITEPLANWATTALSSFFGFADGGVMTSAGPLPLRRYSTGGIASTPQLAMFGEGRTPEAFVPLPDGRSIPVQMRGAGGGNTYNLNLTVAPPPNTSRTSANQWGAEAGRQIQHALSRNG